MKMLFKAFITFIKFLRFGATSIIRVLVKIGIMKNRYRIDIDKDGETDIDIHFHDGKQKHNQLKEEEDSHE